MFLYRFMQFMKHNRGTMDLQRWMTRFQLTGNRLIESWMHLLPDLEITSPEAITHVARRRQAHEANPMNQPRIAAATPGAKPHVNVPWTDELATAAFLQPNENRRITEKGISLRWQLVSIDFCKPGRFDARSQEHTHKYHDTSWKNMRSVQCARTQRFIPGHVLHNKNSSWQSYDATIWHWTEKIVPRSGWRWIRRNRRLLGRRWWRWRRRWIL